MSNTSPHSSAACPAVLAGVGHGSHVCAFYETKEDLFDLVLPFLAAGLNQNELCLWLVPEFINMQEARCRISEAIPGAEIELHAARSVYVRRGRFARELIERFWYQKVEQASGSHRAGTHVAADAFWLQPNDWDAFLQYEADINAMVASQPIAGLCTYPFSVSKLGDVFDVARAHHFAIAKRRNQWQVVTPSAVDPDKQAEAVDASARVALLSQRERQVLEAVIDGKSNKEIAAELGLDVRTIESHRLRLTRRLGVRTMIEAVRLGVLARLVMPEAISAH